MNTLQVPMNYLVGVEVLQTADDAQQLITRSGSECTLVTGSESYQLQTIDSSF